MLHRAIATLRATLRPHLGLGKDRVETLALTRGLNLEDTRLTDPKKLDLLMGLVALAIAWAARAARDLLGTKWPRRKAHGYLAKSWFRTGFDQIRHLLRSDPLEAIAPWLRIIPKHIKISRVV
jgi:hypothetical protein